MKKFACLFLVLLLSIPCCTALAAEKDTGSIGDVLAPNYIVVDAYDPSIVLFERNADESCIPGSTMKIMTCILILELCSDLDERVIIQGNAAALKETNSLMNVIKGEDLSIRELLYGLMLESGNDAALTLALRFGGEKGVEGFAALMNEKAKAIGMSDATCFVNASGAFKRDQRSTPRDMALLTCYALKNETFRQIVSAVHYTIPANTVRTKPMEMTNSNRLISDPIDSEVFCAYANGVKTGSTERGGKCLVSSATVDGAAVVAVLLGATEGGSKNARMTRVFIDAKQLMERALNEQYMLVTPSDLGLTYSDTVSINAATNAVVTADFTNTASIRLPLTIVESIKIDPASIIVTAQRDESATLGVSGDIYGLAIGSYRDRILFSAPITVDHIVAISSTPKPIQEIPADIPAAAKTTHEQSSTAHLLLILFVVLIVITIASIVALLIIMKQKHRRR
ncbi:MAG: hypothetical protein RRZ24_00040 [Clostridia bacterium]